MGDFLGHGDCGSGKVWRDGSVHGSGRELVEGFSSDRTEGNAVGSINRRVKEITYGGMLPFTLEMRFLLASCGLYF